MWRGAHTRLALGGTVKLDLDAGADSVAETYQGRVSEHIDVRGRYTIQGALENGATVRPGGELIVQGAVAGTIRVEPEGTASLQGAIAADIDNRGGVVMVAGIFTGAVLANEGSTAFAVGTLVETHSGNVMQLTSDGSVTPARSQENVKVGTEYFVLDGSGRFLPIDEGPKIDSSRGRAPE